MQAQYTLKTHDEFCRELSEKVKSSFQDSQLKTANLSEQDIIDIGDFIAIVAKLAKMFGYSFALLEQPNQQAEKTEGSPPVQTGDS